MSNQIFYTDDANLDNLTKSPLTREEINMDDTIKLIDFVDIWLNTFKKNTVKAASFSRLECSRNVLRRYSIAQKEIGQIDFFDLQEYINELVKAGYGMSGLKKQFRIVSSPLKQAAAIKIIKADPSVGVRLPVESNVQKKAKDISAYTTEQQEKLNRVAKSEEGNVGYLAVLFMIETGLRMGELLALKWKDIQLDRSRMHVHATIINPMSNKNSAYQDSPKTKSSNRIIPLTVKAKAILQKLRAVATTGWVFEQNGERYSYKKLMWQTKKLCKLAGVPYGGEHVFRHTFATNCYYKGIEVKILSRLLGHSSVTVTYNTYIHLYGDGFDEMYAALCM